MDICASGNTRMCARRRSAEAVSKTGSPTGVSPEHLAGTFQTLQKGTRGGAKPQWRVVPQSLNSGGPGGGDQDCTTTAYTCSWHVRLPADQYSSTMRSCRATATHRTTTTRLKKPTSGANLDRDSSSAAKGEYQFTHLDLHRNAVFSCQKRIIAHETKLSQS